MMTTDQLNAILVKENKDFFKLFGSVDEYIMYRTHASSIVGILTQMMQSPQPLVQISEAIAADKPYVLTFVNQKYVTGLGSLINEYAERSAESTLSYAHEMSLGAICWEKMEQEDATYYFIWVDPENIKERWTILNKSITKIGMQINKDAEDEEEDEVPEYEEHFAETPTPDLTLN